MGLQLQSPRKGSFGQIRKTGGLLGKAQKVVGDGGIRIGFDSSFQRGLGVFVLTLGKQDSALRQQASGIGGIRAQNLLIERCGFRRPVEIQQYLPPIAP